MASLIYCRSKNDGLSGGAHERGSLKFSSGWTVRVDSNNITAAAVLALGLAAGDLPAIGSLSIDDPQAACVDLHGTRETKMIPACGTSRPTGSARRPASAIPVTTRSSPISGGHAGAGGLSPFRRRALSNYGGIDWTSGNTYQAPQLLADAAWTPFDPPPDMPIYCDEITIRQYESTSGRAAKRAFLGMSNSDTWQGAGPGTAFVDQIETQDEFVQGTWWWLQTYVILIKPRIQIELPSGGYTYIGGFDPEIHPQRRPAKGRMGRSGRQQHLAAGADHTSG